MSLVFSVASPASSTSTSPGTASTGTSRRACWRARNTSRCRPRSAANVARAAARAGSAAPSSPANPGSGMVRRPAPESGWCDMWRILPRGPLRTCPGTAYPGGVNDVSWGALALSLSVVGGIYTWWALRHRGVVAAVRGAGLTLLPLAAWMTGLLEVVGEISNSLSDWLAHLVFSPKTWLGMIIGFVAIVLIGGANAIARRGKPDKPAKAPSTKAPKAVGPTKTPDPLIDDEMAEIQAILKKRGIS